MWNTEAFSGTLWVAVTIIINAVTASSVSLTCACSVLMHITNIISSVQLLSRVWLFVTPRTAACQASLSIINSQSLLRLMSITSVMPSIHPSHPLLSPSPPAFNLSPNQGLFQESVLYIRWPKYWSFSFSISLPSEYSGKISFRMDWLDLLTVKETLKNLVQHHSSKASVLSFLYSPTLTSIHDYWNCHSFYLIQ